jgi:DNA-binding MarR family transcriptional regulator
MGTPDDIIHQPVRLRLMAALTALPSKEDSLDFKSLKKLTGATDGNLGAHIDTLERAGYVTVEKRFAGRRPQTLVKVSPSGRRAFSGHVAFLREVIGE